MTNKLEIRPSGPVCGRIRPPGSKSITNRALVCAALARGRSVLVGMLNSEDTHVMIEALRELGISIDVDSARATASVEGCDGQIPAGQADLYVANSGTTARFLAAMLTLANGTYRIDGTERMRERPIQDLLDALNELGAEAQSEQSNGCPPVVVHASGLTGGRAAIRGDVSSQFLSGLLMAAPYAQQSIEVVVDGSLSSQPYVRLTMAVMDAFGAQVQDDQFRAFHISNQHRYTGRHYEIEPDASAASYFFAAAAITGGEVTVEGLSRDSLQGDVAFANVLARMGCDVRYGKDQITVVGRSLEGIEIDMNAISDTVQTLAATALVADGPTTITGVAHVRHKETDRIGALATELRKLGATVDERADGLRIVPGRLHSAEIETYDDHRMAMSLSLVGLVVAGVVIRDPQCTAKTYPRYFEDLAELVSQNS